MSIAMMQPAFMPWLGYFELIFNSDKFIFLDDFQFSVQSYHQRNRLFVNKGQVDWYSVPIRKSVSFKRALNQTLIDESSNWRIKMLRRIQYNYSKTQFYDNVAPLIEKWLLTKAESLAEQNMVFIKLVCRMLGFEKEFYFSSRLQSEKERSERVIELIRWLKAECYYCARGAFGYMCEDGVFPVDGITVLFQDFQCRPYHQIGLIDDFIPYLSILDALMNIGPEKTAELVRNGTARWHTWESMISAQS